MKKSRVDVSFLTFLLFCVLFTTLADANEGFDIFVKALQSQGASPQVIHTGYFEYVLCIRRSTLSDFEIKAEHKRIEDMYREELKDDPDLELMIADIPAKIKRKYGSEKKMKGRVLLSGNLGEGDCKRLFEMAYYDNANAKWGEATVSVREDHFGKTNSNVIWEPDAQLANVGNLPSTLADFHRFGRAQGAAIDLVTFSLLDPLRRDEFLFSKKNIEDLRIGLDKLGSMPKNSFLLITGNAVYDDGATAVILETKINGKVFQRYWIDRSRGYVCPLIQYYDENACLVEEYKSSKYVQHTQTGLWYPTVHVETKYDPKTGNMVEQREYQINPTTLQLNQSVSENEFAIDIPEGVNVLDNRNPKSEKRYLSTAKGTLSLAPGGLDLDKMPWLSKEEKKDNTLRPAEWNVTRYILMSSGIIIMLTALFFKWKEWRKRHA